MAAVVSGTPLRGGAGARWLRAASIVIALGLVLGAVASDAALLARGDGSAARIVPASDPATITGCPPRCAAIMTETGLPNGTSWSVTLDAKTTTEYSNNSTITFYLYSGPYNFTVGSVEGYTASPSSGTFTMNNSSIGIPISFQKNAVFLGLSLNGTLALVGGLIIGLLIGIVLTTLFIRKPRSPTPVPASPPPSTPVP
jgi:hypothetical protein